MNTVKKIFELSLTEREAKKIKKMMAILMMPIMVFYMTSMNFLALEMMRVSAEDVAVTSDPPSINPSVDEKKDEPVKEDLKTEPKKEEVKIPETPAKNENTVTDDTVKTTPETTIKTITPSVENKTTSPVDDKKEEVKEATWVMDGKTATISPVELGKIYKAPQNDKVSVTFTKLPEKPGSLSIKEIKLTSEEQATLGALTDTAYDITSDMKNGTFEYDLTLPYPDKKNNEKIKTDDVQVLYTEKNEIKKEDLKNVNEDEKVAENANDSKKVMELKGLDHFTIFVVIGTNTELFDESSSEVVINEFLYDGSEWVELFNKTSDPVDLTGWKICELTTSTENCHSLSGSIIGDGFFTKDLSGVLNNDGDTITLKDNSSAVVSRVTYDDSAIVNGQNIGNVNSGQSVARTENGGTDWEVAANPTKGYSNESGSITNANSGQTYTTIQAAIDAATAGNTISLAAGTYELTAQLNVTKPLSIIGQGEVTIKAINDFGSANGSKHLLTIYTGTSSSPVNISNITLDANSKSYGVNTYNNAYGVLNNVTIKNSKGAGLTVNGSTIDATGLDTSGNSWGAVNVDPGSGVTTASVFILNSGTLAEETQIWSDGKYVSGSATVSVTAAGYDIYKIGGTTATKWTDRELDNAVTITKDSVTILYSTIQAALNAAIDGDTINVAAGTYTEGQIIIDKNITLAGEDKSTTIIHPSSDTAMPAGGTNEPGDGSGWFVISPGANPSISGFTFDGAGKNIGIGILSHGGGTIEDNIITDIRYAQYRGFGIYLWNGTTAIVNNSFSDIERVGIILKGSSSDATISENTYTGKGSGDKLDYGIELGAGAHATITNNNISNNVGVAYDGSTSAGIMITTYYGAGTIATITGNTISDCTDGIADGYDAADSSAVTAHSNKFINCETGVNSTHPTTNATENWWGDQSGPSGQGSGIGSAVSENVNFSSWCLNESCSSMSDDVYYASDGEALSDTPQDISVGGLTINGVTGTGNIFVARYNNSGDVPGGGTAFGADGLYFNIDVPVETDFPIDIEIAYSDNPSDSNYLDENHFFSLYYQEGGTWHDYKLDTVGTTGYDPSTISIDKNANKITASLQHLTPIVPVVDITAPSVPTGGTPNDAHIPTNNFDFDWDDSTDDNAVTYEFQSSMNPAQSGGVLTTGLWHSGVLPTSMIHSSGAPDGTWYWQVRAIDSLGNTSAWSEIWNVTIDHRAPTVDLVFSGTGSSVKTFQAVFSEDVNESEAENPANYFLDNWPGAGGSGDLDGHATISYDSSSHTATVTLTTSGWYISPEQEWGVENIHDLAGNVQSVNPYSETSTSMVAPTDPGTPTSAPNPTNNVLTQAWTWLASTDPGGSGVKGYFWNVYNVIAGTYSGWSWVGNVLGVSTSLLDGQYQMQVKAQDKAGNESGAVNSATLTVDSVPPVITINPYSHALTNDDITVTASTDEGTLNITSHTFTANGSFDFVATDDAGNTTTKTVTITNIDKTLPVVSITAPAAGASVSGTVAIRGAVTEDHPHHYWLAIYKKSNGQQIYSATVNHSDEFTDRLLYSWNTIGRSDGVYQIKFAERDAADNRSADFVTEVTVDNTAPTATISYNPTTWTSGSVVATLNPSEPVTVTNNSGNTTHTFTDNGTFTFEFSDAAGNTGTATATVSNIDKTGPSVPVLVSPIGGAYINDNTPLMQWDDSSDTGGSGMAGYEYQVYYNCSNPSNIPGSCSGRYYRSSPLIAISQLQAGTTADNTYYWQVRAKDNVGNFSAWSGLERIVIDTHAPTLSSQTIFFGWYNTTPQTSTFNYTDINMADGYTAPTCDITTEGTSQTCSVTPNVCDKAGNCNTTTVTSNGANIDLTRPESTITSPSGGEDGVVYLNEWNGLIAGTAADNLSGVAGVKLSIERIISGAIEYWNGSAWQSGEILVDASGTISWNYTLASLEEAEYTINSHALDVAGNMENTFTLKIVLDKTIPTVDLSINPANPNGDNDWYITNPEITLSANDKNLDRIEYQIDSNSGTWTVFSTPVKIDDGKHVFYYHSVDKAGNISSVGMKNVKVDTREPDNVKNLDAEYDEDNNSVKLSWDADDSDISEVYIYQGKSREFHVGSSSRIAKNDDNDENYTDDNIQRGEKYYYKFVTKDEAGNTSDVKIISVKIPQDGGEAVVTDEGTEILPQGTVLGEQSKEEASDEQNSDNPEANNEGNQQVAGEETSGENSNLSKNENWPYYVTGGVFLLLAGIFWRRRRKKEMTA